MVTRKRQSRFQSTYGPLLLAGFCFAAYFPVLDAGYIWDDDNYVTANYTLRTTEGLRDIWFKPDSTPQYYPLVHSTFWLEYQLWELEPTGYHATNVVLHLLNSLLLWQVLLRLNIPSAFAAALIFAVHPVHVESVAWITERKNVLSGFFYLASMLVFLRYAEGSPDLSRPIHRSVALYGVGLLLFFMALLSKTVAVTLPVALLICLFWRTGHVSRRTLKIALPLLIVGLPFGLVTIHLERTHVGATGPWWDFSLLERTLIAGRSFWFYVTKIAVPYPLVFVYPRWAVHTGELATYLFPAGAAAAILAAGWFRRGIAMAVLFFFVTISPALGFVNIYPMRYTFAADHYQYLASIGPILVFLSIGRWVAQRSFGRSRRSGRVIPADAMRRLRWASLVLVCVILMWRTRVETEKFDSSETLWRDTLTKDPQSEIAWVNLGNELRDRGQLRGALNCYRQAIRFGTQDAIAAVNAASILHVTGHTDMAIADLRRIIAEGMPEVWLAHFNLGVIRLNRQELPDAKRQFELALNLRPENGQIQNGLGLVAWKQGKMSRAEQYFRAAAEASPIFVDSSVNLAALLNAQGRHSEAAAILESVLRIQPDHEKAQLQFQVATETPSLASETSSIPDSGSPPSDGKGE